MFPSTPPRPPLTKSNGWSTHMVFLPFSSLPTSLNQFPLIHFPIALIHTLPYYTFFLVTITSFRNPLMSLHRDPYPTTSTYTLIPNPSIYDPTDTLIVRKLSLDLGCCREEEKSFDLCFLLYR